jgi:hypothetical protein
VFKLNQLLNIVILILVPLGFAQGQSSCVFPGSFVKQTLPVHLSEISAYNWEVGKDKRSDEFLKTLRILYKNGDHAVIQHKYCSMYNIEVVYLRNSQSSYLDEKSIAKTVAGLFEQYSVLKVKFSRPLADIVSSSLKSGGFDVDKDISIGLPENQAEYQNNRVEYSIDYKTLDEFSSVYSSVIKFYVGVGGES